MAEQEKKSKPEDQIQISTFYLGDTLCGIDITLVQEINDNTNFTGVPLSADYIRGIMNLRGQIVTVIDQSKKIGFEPTVLTPKSRVIIVNAFNENTGLLVDQIADVIVVDRKRIKSSPSNINGIQGEFIKGVVQTDNNELVALLDINVILKEV
ncbi:MAG: purine-binding chemotaxis protein CheW [Gammaproteobacteria bacterium]|nr:purine-binding chemotaxis protein CheW [Gammaproteobacteria bacterium]